MISLTGLSPSMVDFSKVIQLSLRVAYWVLQPRRTDARRFGLFRFRSPLLTESLLFSLPPGTEMFHFPGFAPFRVTGHDSCRVTPFGNPRINGCIAYPWLIADYYVLHRLLVPRHPPYALCNLSKSLYLITGIQSISFKRCCTLMIYSILPVYTVSL